MLRYFCAFFQLVLVEDYWDNLSQVEQVAAGVNTHIVSAYTGYGLERLGAYLLPGNTLVFLAPADRRGGRQGKNAPPQKRMAQKPCKIQQTAKKGNLVMNMKIVSYFTSENQPALKEKLAACDWSAARFLVELLDKGSFFETLGGWGDVLMLMDGETLVSFATLAGQDAVRDERLTPWIGFVFTDPAYRGHRYAGQVLHHAERLAAEKGYGRIYIATDYVNLYEKYGYIYQENRMDCWGDDMRVLFKDLEVGK